MVDYLAQDADFVVRYQGGNNAGHTVVNEFGEFKLHLIPSGVFNANAFNVLGPGMVIDLEVLVTELKGLRDAGVACENIKVSDRATICFPFHRLEDNLEEERLKGAAIGSTRQGIAPAYSDRFLRKAVQVGELKNRDRLVKRIRETVAWKNLVLCGVYESDQLPVDADEMIAWVDAQSAEVSDYICDTTELLHNGIDAGKKVMLEAQLGALRDINFGIYPYTTSSCTLAGFGGIGSGLFAPLDEVIAVTKAFSTCVGAGPFVTELDDEEAHSLREVSKEYGATTGRPRRIGHFDAVATRYGVRAQNATDIAITKLDSLSGRKSLKICTEYNVNGQKTKQFPFVGQLDDSTPEYIEMPGWDEDITGVREFDKLPKTAQDYINKIESLIGVKARFISVGPERDQLIIR